MSIGTGRWILTTRRVYNWPLLQLTTYIALTIDNGDLFVCRVIVSLPEPCGWGGALWSSAGRSWAKTYFFSLKAMMFSLFLVQVYTIELWYSPKKNWYGLLTVPGGPPKPCNAQIWEKSWKNSFFSKICRMVQNVEKCHKNDFYQRPIDKFC